MSALDEVFFSVREAAEYFHVSVSAVQNWISRYHLEPVGWDRRPHGAEAALYRFTDLAQVERQVRQSGKGRPRQT